MKKLYILKFFIFSTLLSSAQIVVTPSVSEDIVIDWLGGADVNVSNLSVECDSAAYGTFVNPGIANELDVSNGLILATGHVIDAVGPVYVNSGASGPLTNTFSGDADLEQTLPGYSMNDVCRIEFDIEPTFENMIFNYVFGSNEYLTWVNSPYNDIFAFYVSGPGIDGPYSNGAENYSLVPGTDLAVSIDNVNNEANSDYYINNEIIGDSSVAGYKGLTTNFTGNVSVIPGETYHVKIVIADAGDTILDSGVFLVKDCFKSAASVGIQELNSLDISIYPNPTSEYLKLIGEDLNGITAYEIYNVEGKKVKDGSINANLNINVRNLEVGNYVLNIYAGSKVVSSVNWMKK